MPTSVFPVTDHALQWLHSSSADGLAYNTIMKIYNSVLVAYWLIYQPAWLNVSSQFKILQHSPSTDWDALNISLMHWSAVTIVAFQVSWRIEHGTAQRCHGVCRSSRIPRQCVTDSLCQLPTQRRLRSATTDQLIVMSFRLSTTDFSYRKHLKQSAFPGSPWLFSNNFSSLATVSGVGKEERTGQRLNR